MILEKYRCLFFLKLASARLLCFLVIFAVGATVGAEVKHKRLPYEPEETKPVSLAYTHLLPSTEVIPGGTFVLGTTLGLGVLDLFDVTTNLYLDLAQVFNIGTKIHLFRNDEFAVAAFATYTSQSIQVVTTNVSTGAQANLSQTFTALSPGVVVSYYLLPQLTGHSGFTYTSRSPVLNKSDFQPKNGFVQGNVINQELTVGLSDTLALSAGGSYDLTYDITGAGASLHIGGFQIGGHYYFNVSQGSFLPILGGGYSVNY